LAQRIAVSRRLLALLALAGLTGLALVLALDDGTEPEESGEARVPAVAAPLCQDDGGKCGWSVQLAATPGRAGTLVDVSCAAPAFCMAVGNEHHGGGAAEVRTGGRWQIVARFDQEVKAVSCPTETWCKVVGSSGVRSWTLQRDQASTELGGWQVKATPTPRPKGGTEVLLNDVSCLSKTNCTLVGIYRKPGYEAYVAHWDGNRWAFDETVGRLSGVTHGMLSVSCPTRGHCVMAGTYQLRPLVQHWDGRQWRVATVPYPEGSTEAAIQAVSCTSPSACIAVGNVWYDVDAQPFAVRWDGKKWAILKTPAPSGGGSVHLNSISCLPPGACIAAGSVTRTSSTSSAESAVSAIWEGTEWTWLTTPHPNMFNSLAAVSCVSREACTAVGWAGSRPIAEDRPTSAPLTLRLG
jgi:hypothetical protein